MEKKNTHIMYGFITGIAMVIVSLIIYLLGAAFKPGVQYISYIPFLVGMILNGMAFSKANDGYVTFGNVFGSCFKGAMIVTIVIVVWSVASMYIFPEMKTKAIEIARQSMIDKKMPDDQIDTALNITMKYWNVFLIAGGIFGTLFFGAIFSLIAGAIAKKKGENPFKGNEIAGS